MAFVILEKQISYHINIRIMNFCSKDFGILENSVPLRVKIGSFWKFVHSFG